MIHFERMMLVRKAQHIQRFHTRTMLHRQSVGEHTFGVLCILLEVVPEASDTLIKAALYHDVAEAETGDVPSPTLHEFTDIGRAVKAAEQWVNHRHGISFELTDREKDILEFCDSMECMVYCLEEWYRGNRNALAISENCADSIRKNSLHKVSPQAEMLFGMYNVKLNNELINEGDVDERE